MIMNLNEALTRQNVLTKILLKEGDRELPKELKVKVMRMRMAYSKIKKNFDNEVQEFIKELMTPEIEELNQKINKSEEENIKLEQLTNEVNSTYQEFLTQKGLEEINSLVDYFTLDEYSDIVEVNVANDVEINGAIIKAVDFLEVIYDLFVKENGIS